MDQRPLLPYNKHEVPPVIWELLARDEYDYVEVPGKKIITPSSLGMPAQMGALIARHRHEIRWDVTSRYYTMFGKMIHSIVERFVPDSSLSESRLVVPVPGREDWMMAFKPDLVIPEELCSWAGCTPSVEQDERGRWNYVVPELHLQPKELKEPWRVRVLDNKVTSANSPPGVKKEWRSQTYAYTWGLMAAARLGMLPAWLKNLEVTGIDIQLIFRDWMRSRARVAQQTGKEYPDCPFQTLCVSKFITPFGDRGLTAGWDEEHSIVHEIQEKCDTIDSLQDVPDEELPACSLEDRWNRDSCYSVKGVGNKRATKNWKVSDFRNENECRRAAEEDARKRTTAGKEYTVDRVLGMDIRCEDYCDAAAFCAQRLANKAEAEIMEDEALDI